jgi:hypothetical protein
VTTIEVTYGSSDLIEVTYGAADEVTIRYAGVAGPQGPTGATKTADYVLVTADAGELILIDSALDEDVTVDASLDLSVGQRIDLLRMGAGEVTVVASGTTVNASPGLKLRAQYSAATLLCVGTDSYVLLGDLKA